MKITKLYKYDRGGGKITVTINRPIGTPSIVEYRVIADEGKILTKDFIDYFIVIDITILEETNTINELELTKEIIKKLEGDV